MASTWPTHPKILAEPEPKECLYCGYGFVNQSQADAHVPCPYRDRGDKMKAKVR